MHTHVSKLDLRRKTLITQPPPPEKEWSDGFGHEMEPLPPEITHKETKLLSAITFLGGRGFDLAAAAAAAAAAATWKGGSGRGRTERDGRGQRMRARGGVWGREGRALPAAVVVALSVALAEAAEATLPAEASVSDGGGGEHADRQTYIWGKRGLKAAA